LFALFDFISKGLYKNDLGVGLKSWEIVKVPNILLVVWLCVYLFCLIGITFVTDKLWIGLSVMLPFLLVNYLVEFACHFKAITQIPECIPLIDEPTPKIIFSLNWKSYFLSAVINKNNYLSCSIIVWFVLKSYWHSIDFVSSCW